MSTTTIRIPPALKSRAERVAERAGTTTHAFILQALEQHVLAAEVRAQFLSQGEQRLVEMESTGVAVPWQEARQYLLDRAAGRPAGRPAARPLGVQAEASRPALRRPGAKPRKSA